MPTKLAAHDGRRSVVDLLTAQFTGVLPGTAVIDEVALAERELTGQVPAGALEELTHRLAGQRLRQRCRAGDP